VEQANALIFIAIKKILEDQKKGKMGRGTAEGCMES
jgi:hypothetical protein